jgi:hypothetical protein
LSNPCKIRIIPWGPKMNGKNIVFFQLKYLFNVGLLLLGSGFYSFIYAEDLRILSEPSDTVNSMKEKKPVKRYIQPCLYFNSYGTPEQTIDNDRLKTYKFNQSNLGFYLPMFTKTWYKEDSISLANFHLLLTGNALTAQAQFSGIKGITGNHTLIKLSLGMRAIYNTGNKNIWFFNASPFVSQDDITISDPAVRIAAIALLNRTVSRTFSYRLGLIKTFSFGRSYELPIVGFRFGPLDGCYLTIQFPRNASFNFPMGKKFTASVFARVVGGLYNYSNRDNTFLINTPTVQFSRTEIQNGFQANYRPSSNFTFFSSMGLVYNRNIRFAYNTKTSGSREPIYSTLVQPTIFLNIGISARFGKAKKVYGNYQMYEVFNLNNSYEFQGLPNSEIPVPSHDEDLKTIKKIQYRDIQDLLFEEP